VPDDNLPNPMIDDDLPNPLPTARELAQLKHFNQQSSKGPVSKADLISAYQHFARLFESRQAAMAYLRSLSCCQNTTEVADLHTIYIRKYPRFTHARARCKATLQHAEKFTSFSRISFVRCVQIQLKKREDKEVKERQTMEIKSKVAAFQKNGKG
jgi:hypothetical protein